MKFGRFILTTIHTKTSGLSQGNESPENGFIPLMISPIQADCASTPAAAGAWPKLFHLAVEGHSPRFCPTQNARLQNHFAARAGWPCPQKRSSAGFVLRMRRGPAVACAEGSGRGKNARQPHAPAA